MASPEFWQGKRVFITGHTGFKGSWLSLWLQEMGADVTGYALNPSTDLNMFDSCRVSEGMTSIYGDVCDSARLSLALQKAAPEIVFHLAAQPIVRISYEQPVETYHVNVMGTVHLLEAVRRARCARALVVVTSDKCYENREWYWSYREKSMLGGDDPYSNSKACAELVFGAYSKSFFNPDDFDEHGLALATARAGNVIGGGDWATDRLVPDVIRSLMENKPVQIRNPHATRPWQHVLEPLNGYLILAEHLYNDGVGFNGSWNFGPRDANDKQVSWIVNRLYELLGASDPWERDTRPQPHENIYLKLDSSKARALLGWDQTLHLNTTLSWIVEWTQQYQNGAEMRAFTQDQIRKFAGLVQRVIGVFAFALCV